MIYLLTLHDQHRVENSGAVLGTSEVPVTTMQPLTAIIPVTGARLVYLLDLEALTPEQVESLIEYCALSTGRDRDDVAKKIKSQGFPILAQQASIKVIDTPNFTLSAVFP